MGGRGRHPGRHLGSAGRSFPTRAWTCSRSPRRTWRANPTPPAKKPDAAPAAKEEPRVPGKLIASEADFAKAIQPEKELPDSVSGVLVRARLDPDHWITAGAGETVNALVSGRAIYAPIKLDKGVNAAYFDAADKLLASGYLWEENRKQLAYKPLMVVQPEGRGFVSGLHRRPQLPRLHGRPERALPERRLPRAGRTPGPPDGSSRVAQAFSLCFAAKRKKPGLVGAGLSDLIRATSYSPTHSRVQYHRG